MLSVAASTGFVKFMSPIKSEKPAPSYGSPKIDSKLLKYSKANTMASIMTMLSAIFHLGTPLSANGSVMVRTGKAAILVRVAAEDNVDVGLSVDSPSVGVEQR